MQKLLITFSLLASITISKCQWLTDLSAAQSQAQRENKAILVDFTGSDWCGWCIKLKKEVFSQPAFQTFASRHLVLLEVDFPRRKNLPKAQKEANQELAQKFRVRGYPTVVILNPQGQELARTGYRPGGPQPFINEISKFIGVAVHDNPATSRTKSNQAAKPAPLYGGAPLQPPPKYDDLELKGISGKSNRRFALINNHTFMEGESAAVKFEDGVIKVRCVEIKKESVIIEVGPEKEQREVYLNKTY